MRRRSIPLIANRHERRAMLETIERPHPIRCGCGRWGAYAIVTVLSANRLEERACYLPQCRARRAAELRGVARVRDHGAAGEIRAIDARFPHRSEPLQMPLVA